MTKNLFDLGARVAAVYPIGMIGDPENPPSWLYDIAGSTFLMEHLQQDLPEWRPIADLARHHHTKTVASALADAMFLARRGGFIVRAEVKARQYYGETEFEATWDHYCSLYLHAPDAFAILPRVLTAAEKLHDIAKADWRRAEAAQL
ncbi:hypothetical protein [Rhizobium sp. 11_C7_N12_5]|uniref:hypothetical protein n=1 Tax=Rhizobium sp. 11_C7_N12_5 TaxID=3240770 RepID=UPI003F204D03